MKPYKTPCHEISHLIRRIAWLERCLQRGNELFDIGEVCQDWFGVRDMLERALDAAFSHLRLWRKDMPELVAYFEALPLNPHLPGSHDDIYFTGRWVMKYNPNLGEWWWVSHNAQVRKLYPSEKPF
jgi:hypothetical protein